MHEYALTPELDLDELAHRMVVRGTTSDRVSSRSMRRLPWWCWLIVGGIAGWLLTVSVLHLSGSSPRVALREDVAWQGWLGTVVGTTLGAIASIGVALFVLDKTISEERDRAIESSDRDRELVLDQVRHERELAIEGRRVAAWAGLVGAVHSLSLGRPTVTDVLDAYREANREFWNWRSHMSRENSTMYDLVWESLTGILRCAKGGGPVDAARVSRYVHLLEVGGSMWHSPDGVDSAERSEILKLMRRDLDKLAVDD